MPGGNGTGPTGMGPKTGRAAGFCSGFSAPGFSNPGMGRGFFARGNGRFFHNRGHRNRFYSMGYSNGLNNAGTNNFEITPEQELSVLKNQVNFYNSEIDSISKRINDLENQD